MARRHGRARYGRRHTRGHPEEPDRGAQRRHATDKPRSPKVSHEPPHRRGRPGYLGYKVTNKSRRPRSPPITLASWVFVSPVGPGTGDPLSARRLREMVELGAREIAIELLVAAQAVDLHKFVRQGRGTRNAYREVDTLVSFSPRQLPARGDPERQDRPGKSNCHPCGPVTANRRGRGRGPLLGLPGGHGGFASDAEDFAGVLCRTLA